MSVTKSTSVLQSSTWPVVNSSTSNGNKDNNSSDNSSSINNHQGEEFRRIKNKSAAINPFTLNCANYNTSSPTTSINYNCNSNNNNENYSRNYCFTNNNFNGHALNSAVNMYDNKDNHFQTLRGNEHSSVIQVLEQTRLERWANHVYDLMQTHKSVFVAADLVLHELERMKREVGNSVALCLSTILTVLQFCIPRLGKEQRAMLNAAVEELIPIITFSQLNPVECGSYKFTETQINNSTRISQTITNTSLSNIVTSKEANMSFYNTISVQRTYAECFHNVLAHFAAYLHASKVHERREKIETLVMERVVSALDALWLKLCFKAWRAHISTLNAVKMRFRQLMERGMVVDVIPHFIYKWRQHAHTFMLHEKLARLGEVNKMLKSLEPVFQSVHTQRDRLSVEVKEKMHHLEISEKALRECNERYKALAQLSEETTNSIHEHRRLWRECLQMLFEDAYKHNEEWHKSFTELLSSNRFVSNITDTAALFMSRAQARTDHVGPRELWQLLVRNGAVMSIPEHICEDNNNNILNANIKNGEARYEYWSTHLECKPNDKLHSSELNKSVECEHHHNRIYNHNHYQQQELKEKYITNGGNNNVMSDVLVAKIAQACSPVVSPLTIHDAMDDNQAKMKLTFMFLECLFGGGHCSLFKCIDDKKDRAIEDNDRWITLGDNKIVSFASQYENAPCDNYKNKEQFSEPIANSQSALNSDSHPQNKSIEISYNNNNHNNCNKDNIEQEEDCCSRMIDQITNGVESLQDCKDTHDEYLMHIHRCMTESNLELTQDMLGMFYAQWSRLGKQLDRTRMENALACIVSFHDEQVLRALYPNSGLSTLVELTHYLSSVAEFVNWPLVNVVEWVTTHYAFTTEEMHQLEFSSKPVTHFFRSQIDNVKLLYERVKNDTQVARVSRDKLEECFTKYLDISYDEFDEMLKVVNSKFDSEEGGDVLQRDNLEFLLFTAAKVQDPSPFTDVTDKLQITM